MAGLQDKIELARKSGYSDAEIVAHLGSSGDLSAKIEEAKKAGYGDSDIIGYLGQAPKRSTMQEVGRQVGLTARHGIEGLTAIPNMIGDAVGLESSKTVSDWLTKLGLPQAEGAQERVVGDVTRAMAGQGGTVKLGQAMTNAAGPVAKTVGDLLASRSGAQVAGAVGASGAAGTTREMGGGAGAQTVAGLMGGLVAPVAADVVVKGTKAAGRGVVAAAKPFTESGRQEVVGDTLKRLATNPEAAQQRLADAAEIVPGSQPTTAQASRDPGLLTAERALRSGPTGGQFAERAGKQNQARNILLSNLAGDDAALKAAKSERSAAAKTAYGSALDQPITAPKELTDLAKRPAVAEAVKRAKAIALEEGVELGDPMSSVKGLHYIKLALDDTLDSSFTSGIGKTQKHAIEGSRQELLSLIDKLSPDYKAAREQFAAQSKPVNQMETLQGIQSKVLNAGTDAQTGERIMSPAKFYQAVTKNEGELAKTLTPEQMDGLRRISKDLDRGALSDSAGRAGGSNTYQNVSTAYVLGQALGGNAPSSPVLQNLLRPLAWLNKLNEPQLQELLTDAMLDPAIARSLMGKASPRAVESVALELTQRARAFGIGSAQGVAAQASGDKQR